MSGKMTSIGPLRAIGMVIGCGCGRKNSKLRLAQPAAGQALPPRDESFYAPSKRAIAPAEPP